MNQFENNRQFHEFLDSLSDEIIRQVTINCTERGLLLLRVRDEINMRDEAYETLYCSSVAFGMRKVSDLTKDSIQSSHLSSFSVPSSTRRQRTTATAHRTA
jgi:hypothetical protein